MQNMQKTLVASLVSLVVLMAGASAVSARKIDTVNDYRRTLFTSAGQRNLVLEAPRDMCFADETNPLEQMVSEIVRNIALKDEGEKVLSLFAPCMDIAALNAGAPAEPGKVFVSGVVSWPEKKEGTVLKGTRENYLLQKDNDLPFEMKQAIERYRVQYNKLAKVLVKATPVTRQETEVGSVQVIDKKEWAKSLDQVMREMSIGSEWSSMSVSAIAAGMAQRDIKLAAADKKTDTGIASDKNEEVDKSVLALSKDEMNNPDKVAAAANTEDPTLKTTDAVGKASASVLSRMGKAAPVKIDNGLNDKPMAVDDIAMNDKGGVSSAAADAVDTSGMLQDEGGDGPVFPSPDKIRIDAQPERTNEAVFIGYEYETKKNNKILFHAGLVAATAVHQVPLYISLVESGEKKVDRQQMRALLEKMVAQQIALNE